MKIHIFSVALATAIASAPVSSPSSQAQEKENPFRHSAAIAVNEGGVHGGGGDTKTELRIKNIREDLQKWIKNGGAKGLEFSSDVTYSDYIYGNKSKNIFGMNDTLVSGAVVVNAIRASEQRMDDDELNTYVDGKPKTCKSILNGRDQRPHMICEVERFSVLSESEQYQQIHHEYAALGNLEKNVGSDSDYWISSQITAFLTHQVVLKLAVKKSNLRIGSSLLSPEYVYLTAAQDSILKIEFSPGHYEFSKASSGKYYRYYCSDVNLTLKSYSRLIYIKGCTHAGVSSWDVPQPADTQVMDDNERYLALYNDEWVDNLPVLFNDIKMGKISHAGPHECYLAQANIGVNKSGNVGTLSISKILTRCP